jgi:hypothetical protein
MEYSQKKKIHKTTLIISEYLFYSKTQPKIDNDLMVSQEQQIHF